MLLHILCITPSATRFDIYRIVFPWRLSNAKHVLTAKKNTNIPQSSTCFTYRKASTVVEGAKQEDTRRVVTNEISL